VEKEGNENESTMKQSSVNKVMRVMPYRRLIQKQQFFMVMIYVERERVMQKIRRERKESGREAINGPTR
jgi:hypothetical protein